MAAANLTLLRSPEFPQIQALDRLVVLALSHQSRPQSFDRCAYASPESYFGACDSVECRQLATVHHMASELDVCPEHAFVLDLEASRG